jgi:hypothetical protein
MINLLAVFVLVIFVMIIAYVITENSDINKKIKEVDDWIEENFKK